MAASAQQAWKAPRTLDGYPDLQGVWLANRATPLERSAALAGKPFLTDEEVKELYSDFHNDVARHDSTSHPKE